MYFISFIGPYEDESNGSDDDEDLPLSRYQANAAMAAITSRLKSMEKEDGIGQLPQSARQITATIEHLSVTLVNVQTEIASLKETLAIERQQDRDLMKKIYSRLKLMSSNEAPTVTSRVTTPSSTPDIPAVPDQIIIPNIPATPARPPASRPTIPVTPATPVTPVMFEARYLSAPSPGHLLLGGDQGLPRNVCGIKTYSSK